MNADKKTVQQLAYELWEKRGRPDGSADEDWYAAEHELGGGRSRGVDESVRESFPASDPPASGMRDEPPANAEEKWAAAGAAGQQAERKSRAGKRSGRGRGLSADPG